MPNIDNINKTIELIENDKTLTFDMQDYIQVDYQEENKCGTACCIAGYATIAAYGPEPENIPEKYINKNDYYPEETYYDYFEAGRDYLGIDDGTAEKLFIPKFGHIHSTNKDHAIAVLKALRDENKVIWDTLPPPEKV